MIPKTTVQSRRQESTLQTTESTLVGQRFDELNSVNVLVFSFESPPYLSIPEYTKKPRDSSRGRRVILIS